MLLLSALTLQGPSHMGYYHCGAFVIMTIPILTLHNDQATFFSGTINIYHTFPRLKSENEIV